MSNVWRELADPKIHRDFMSSTHEGGMPIEASHSNLIKKWVYFANVCNFTFQFADLAQVLECKNYFERSVHPSTIGEHPPFEHYWQHWYCKLPKGINSKSNSLKVLKVLDKIISKWG